MSQDTSVQQNPKKLTQFRSISLIAVGSNEDFGGNSPTETIQSAVAVLSEKGLVIRAMSAIYRTPAFPPGAGAPYSNAAIAIEAEAPADELLKILQGIEDMFGRRRDRRWGSRTLDLDMISCGDQILPDRQVLRDWIDLPLSEQSTRTPKELILPHPRVQDRAFVLVPLMDIAPDWVHPLTGRSVQQMTDALPKADKDSVKPLVNLEKRT